MLIKQPSDIRPSEITSREDYLSRRRFLDNSLSSALSLWAVTALPLLQSGQVRAAEEIRNVIKSRYSTDEEWTDFDDIISYNNFAEFGIDKEDPINNSGDFQPRPWSIKVEGECDRPGEYALEDIVGPHQMEERIYRLRCVEAWSMVIPWIGIPLGDVLRRFQPNSRAKFVAFTTVYRPDEMPGLARDDIYEWPFREGLRMDEAMHPLTILATGLYGEELLNQNGAPIRLVVPWKYGFKSIKSIVNIRFQETRPPNTFEMFDPEEFGFWANVNPNVDHPRWSQSRERRIGHFFKQDTEMFNGYAEQVASMYSGMDLEKHF